MERDVELITFVLCDISVFAAVISFPVYDIAAAILYSKLYPAVEYRMENRIKT